MRVIINDTEIILPSSLAEFTLGQRIAFQEEHGNLLDQMLKSILEDITDDLEKEVELVVYQEEKMIRTLSFFTNIPVDTIKETEYLDEIANIYYSSLAALMDDEAKVELKDEYTFKGETWVLHPPELKNGSKIKFGEFIDSKQLIKDMIELGKGKWEYMLPICAIFFRKQGEAYSEEFTFEGSERMELLKDLPMDIVMAVGFFLSSSMNMYINTFLSSGQAKPKVAAPGVKSILTVGAGSIS